MEVSVAGRLYLLALAGTLGCLAGARAAEPEPPRHGDWPFVALSRPSVPSIQDDGWGRNVVDRFIWAALAEKQLRPSPEADRRTLLRRVTFDLTGLPPTHAEQASFLADRSPLAYERLVDRILASPAYGERWAQHWLDLVRYAESDGFKEDALRPSAYRYRDYVIRSLNDDLPYDRFLSQQLAGDELEPENPDALVATGFLRLYPDEYNAANVRQRRQEILDDITDTTSVALMGVTMGCARCHDHKFDEVLQKDYFRLQAFFVPFLPRDDAPVAPRESVEAYRRQLAAWEQATATVRGQIDELLAAEVARLRRDSLEKFDAEVRAAVETSPERRTAAQQQLAWQAKKLVDSNVNKAAAGLKGDAKKRYDELLAQLAQSDHLKPAPLPTAMAVVDAAGAPPATFVLVAGNAEKSKDEVQPGFPAFLGKTEPDVSPPPGGASTGRRSALARWLCRPDHPLTARLIANRLWLHHFGEGIVPTANDFGTMGDPPSHPELLDYLASELVASGWRLKALHRLLVTSAAYRQSSLFDPRSPAQAAARAADPENRLLWRARRRRLEGEAIRDAMLSAAGQLAGKMFGPSVRPALPAGVGGQNAWKPDERADEQSRRSIYLLVKRNLRYPLFEAFDQPDLHNSCPRRTSTTTAPQALALLNGEVALDLAGKFAERLLLEHPQDERALVRAAFEAAWCRPPTESQLQTAVEFLSTASAGSTKANAVADFCHVLFNANEFLYVD
jgi:hypothetical protein